MEWVCSFQTIMQWKKILPLIGYKNYWGEFAQIPKMRISWLFWSFPAPSQPTFASSKAISSTLLLTYLCFGIMTPISLTIFPTMPCSAKPHTILELPSFKSWKTQKLWWTSAGLWLLSQSPKSNWEIQRNMQIRPICNHNLHKLSIKWAGLEDMRI